jgi:hypothetical protein
MAPFCFRSESFLMRINREKIADRIAGGALSQLKSDVAALTESFSHARESLLEIEAERRVSGGLWQGPGGGAGREQNDFSRPFIRTAARDARINYLRNPLIRRGVDISALYTFAQGVTVRCEEESANAALQEFWDDKGNRRALTSVTALFIKEVERKTQGNIFLAIFTDAAGQSHIRAIPADQIAEIICNPDDDAQPWYYKRVWTATTFNESTGITGSEERTEYYPALDKADGPERIGNAVARWDAPAYHIKSGTLSDMLFGLCDTFPAHDWSGSYTEFLEDRASVCASLSVWSWKTKAKAGISRVLSSMGTAAGNGVRRALAGQRNAAGQIAGLQGGNELEALDVSGATINPEEGRRLLLMVCAALGIPETFLGDVSVGTLATAESLDWPTVLTFMLVQALWTEAFSDIAAFVLERAGYDPKAAGIQVDWPPIIKQNTVDTVKSITAAAPHFPGIEGKKFIARKLAGALGENKIDELLDKLDFTTPEPAASPSTNPAANPPQGENQ